jgi:hypothetical protein
MGKIGRNDPCFCGSGRKFKKCCLGKGAGGQADPVMPSVKKEIERIRESAAAGESVVRTLGVFVLFASQGGDAWLLEVTDMDAIQVARDGKPLDITIEENPETIEIDWTHKFQDRDRKLVLVSYKDKSETVPEGYPGHSILSTVRKIRKRIPADLMRAIHVENEEVIAVKK